MATRKPPAAPSKARPLPPTRAPPATRRTRVVSQPQPDADSPDAVDALADDLTQLAVRPGTRQTNAATASRPLPARRTGAMTQPPLRQSSAENRSSSRSASAAPSATRPAAAKRPAAATSLDRPNAAPRPPAERAQAASKAINGALAALSTLNKAGFRAHSRAPEAGTPTSSRPASAASTARSGSLARGSDATSTAGSRTLAAQGATRDKVERTAKEATRALVELRELVREGTLGGKRVEVEKAAIGIVANFVEMELYALALAEIAAMRLSLLSWWSDGPKAAGPAPPPAVAPTARMPSSRQIEHFLVSVPPASYLAPPSLAETLDPKCARPTLADLAPLVAAMQQYLLACLFKSAAPDMKERVAVLAKAVRLDETGGGPLAWRFMVDEAYFTDAATSSGLEVLDLEQKTTLRRRLDTSLTAIFGTVTKGFGGADAEADPRDLLDVRVNALEVYATTAALSPSSLDKLSAFLDQVRKTLLLFGRAAEKVSSTPVQISEGVRAGFERIVRALERKGLLSEEVKATPRWRELCDVVLHIARRADDLATIERIAELAGPAGPEETAVDPDAQAEQLTAKVAGALAVFEIWVKTNEDRSIADQLRRTSSLLPVLTRLRCGSPESEERRLAADTVTRVDKTLDRLRYVLVKRIKNGKRLDQLVVHAGSAPPDLHEIDHVARTTLDRVAAHAEQVLAMMPEGRARIQLATTTVDSLLVLAHAGMHIGDCAAHATVLRFLERALAIVWPSRSEPPVDLDLGLHYAIRALSSALYNLGGILYNANMADSGLAFVERACQLASAALQTAESRELLAGGSDLVESMEGLALAPDVTDKSTEPSDEAQRREAVQDLERLMARRWDLLALTQRSLGNKQAAYEASVCSVLARPLSTWTALAAASTKEPLSAVVTRFTDLQAAVGKLTRLGSFDLLLPPEQIPLSSAARTSLLEPPALGALLEMQLHALRSHLDTDEGRQAAAAIADAAGGIYGADEMPLRRARTLVEKIRLQTGPGSAAAAESLVEELSSFCLRSDFRLDGALDRFASQYLAQGHLRLAEKLQSCEATEPDTAAKIAEHAQRALTLLSAAVAAHSPPDPSNILNLSVSSHSARGMPPQPSAPPSPPAPTRSKRPLRAAATPARLRTSTRRPAPTPSEQVTPPSASTIAKMRSPQEPKRMTARTASTPGAEGERGFFDDDLALRDALASFAALLGVRGEVALRLRFLQLLQQIASLRPAIAIEGIVTCDLLLAQVHLELGQLSSAGILLAQMSRACEQGDDVSTAVRVVYWLCAAEYHAHLGGHERSAQAYEAALTLAESLEADEEVTSMSGKILERTMLIRRASQAANACSVMLQRKGEIGGCLAPAMQSMRLATRAVHNITRLSPKPARHAQAADQVFVAAPVAAGAALADSVPIEERSTPASLAVDNHACLYWSLAYELLSRILRVAQLHLLRGTPKSASFFAQQALDLAEDLHARSFIVNALALRCEVALRAGKADDTANLLSRLLAQLESIDGPALAEALVIQGEVEMTRESPEMALKTFSRAQEALDAFADAIQPQSGGAVDASSPPRRASGPSVHFATSFSPSPTANTVPPLPADWVLPGLQSRLIRHRARMHYHRNKPDEGRRLLRRLKRITASEEDKAEELKLLANLQSRELAVRCASDPVLGMLPDSVLSMPAFGASASGPAAKVGTPRTGPSALNAIKDVESLLARALSLGASKSAADRLSELSVISAAMRAMQANVSKGSKRLAALVAHALDLGAAVTLRREMMDAIVARLARSVRLDDLTWPNLLPQVTEPLVVDVDVGPLPSPLDDLRERYRLEVAEPALTETRLSDVLPDAWSLVNICLSGDADALLISRQRQGAEAVVFKLPLDRLARREGDEDLSLPYSAAAATLRDIIDRSNAGTQHAKFVDGKEGRAAWWQERKELDSQLQGLLEGIEDVWLGAFKSVLCDARGLGADAYAQFKSRIERVLKRSMARAAGDRRIARFKVDDAVLECLAALPATAREEDLEDMFYFMAESFQFNGLPLASDETDVDQVVVDFREALEELHGTKSAPKLRRNTDEHTFLILDKHLHAFPWESLPCLRGRSISRLPSTSFLRDRLDLAASRGQQDPLNISFNPCRAAYILNPGNDLKHTQLTFEPWLKERSRACGWSGVVGRVPLEEEVRGALTNQDLLLYFGHGGAEQYIRSQTVRNLSQCAVAMLWGCSSGMLKEQGVFDPTGTPYHYMVGGCPALVANLWDVTDKDIDKFAWSVFRETGIAEPEAASAASEPTVSLTAAVAQSRDVCNLRYLNGAAPVVYGIPVRFQYSSDSPPAS